MAVNVTTGTGPAKLIRNYFQDILDEYLENTLLAADLMESYVLPANVGTTVLFKRLGTFNKQPVGLSGGSAIPGLGEAFAAYGGGTGAQLRATSFTIDDARATINLIGNDLPISELDVMSSEPNPVPELSRGFLYNAADTLDYVYINSMVCSSVNGATQTSTVPGGEVSGSSVNVSVVWGDGSATLTEPTLDADIPSHRIAAESFNTAEATLRAQSAKPKGDGLFHALIAPQSAGDLRVDGTFQDIALKGTRRGEDKFERATIGEVFGCRVMVSENVNVGAAGTVDATNDTIIRAPICGREYAKRISHAKGVGKPSVRWLPPAHSSADVYGLLGFLVWKAYFACVVTHPLNGLVLKTVTTRLRSTASADDSSNG